MSGVMERTLGILELLSQARRGAGTGRHRGPTEHAAQRGPSPAHRPDRRRLCPPAARARATIACTTKLVALGLQYLGQSGVIDLSQPLLDRLAESCGELVRLSVIDGERLTWIAKAQGARQGLRYDPDMGSDARLSCSASGLAWMASMSDDDAAGHDLAPGPGPSPRTTAPTRRAR